MDTPRLDASKKEWADSFLRSLNRRCACCFRGLNGQFRYSACGKMGFVLVEPNHSVAANAFHRLHLKPYVSVTESSTHLVHSQKPNLLRIYSMLAFSVLSLCTDHCRNGDGGIRAKDGFNCSRNS